MITVSRYRMRATIDKLSNKADKAVDNADKLEVRVQSQTHKRYRKLTNSIAN